LLEQTNSDVAELVRRRSAETTALRGAVEAALQLRPTGSARPTFAGALVQALADALHAGQPLGWVLIRSANFLRAVIEGENRAVSEPVRAALVAVFGATVGEAMGALPADLPEALEADPRFAWAALRAHFARAGREAAHSLPGPRVQEVGIQPHVHVCPPREGRPAIVVFTTGMSDLAQRAPAEHAAFRFVELVATLPPTWGGLLDSGASSELAGWFFAWMQGIAGFPHRKSAFVGPGALFPTDGAPLPGTGFSGFIVLTPWNIAGEVVAPGKTIRLLSIVPLYPEEMALKQASGPEPLLQGFVRHQLTESQLWDPQRPNVATSSKQRW
jgi:hypothetical protein